MKVFTLEVGYLGTNCYAVVENNDAVLIDPGADFLKIVGFLEKEKLTLKAIFLTHGHFDHIGAVESLKNEFKIPVYIHKDDEVMAKSPYLNSSYDFGGPEISCSPTDFYDDGDEIPFGDETFKILHTPGHSDGGVCIMISDYLFTGDTLFYQSIGRTDLYNGSYETLAKSLVKLISLQRDYKLFPGHGGSTTLSYEKKTNPYLR